MLVMLLALGCTLRKVISDWITDFVYMVVATVYNIMMSDWLLVIVIFFLLHNVTSDYWWFCTCPCSYLTQMCAFIHPHKWFECDCTLHFVDLITFFYSSSLIFSASFPVPGHLVLQHCKLAWWGPGNETINIMYTCEPSWAKACVALQLSLCSMRK